MHMNEDNKQNKEENQANYDEVTTLLYRGSFVVVVAVNIVVVVFILFVHIWFIYGQLALLEADVVVVVVDFVGDIVGVVDVNVVVVALLVVTDRILFSCGQ